MDPIQKRIRTLQTDIEKLDQVDRVVLLDIGGHVILDLDSIDIKAVKAFLDNRYLKDIEDHRRLQKWAVWTSQAPKEGMAQ